MDRGGYRVAEKQISGITLKDISEKMNVSMTGNITGLYRKRSAGPGTGRYGSFHYTGNGIVR